MNLRAILTAVIISCVLSVITLSSYAKSQAASVKEEKRNIVIKINYGDIRPARTIEACYTKGNTALEVLQRVAEVKTHPVGEYVFVVSIDGVEGKRGETAWYYSVDGKSANKLAYSNILNDVNSMKWEYREDVCSRKVDAQN
jgi:hypothetical protein